MKKKFFIGRLRVILELSKGLIGLSLNIGCKETRFGDVNLDINLQVIPDVVADALHLPFRDRCFNLVYFTDVIEHLPRNTELRALLEIYKVLKPRGVLILTTPNDVPCYTYLDPARYVKGHRHYKVKELLKLLRKAGL